EARTQGPPVADVRGHHGGRGGDGGGGGQGGRPRLRLVPVAGQAVLAAAAVDVRRRLDAPLHVDRVGGRARAAQVAGPGTPRPGDQPGRQFGAERRVEPPVLPSPQHGRGSRGHGPAGREQRRADPAHRPRRPRRGGRARPVRGVVPLRHRAEQRHRLPEPGRTPPVSTSIMLFTRDLRVRDNPTLTAACEVGHVVPVFVLDEAILGGPFAAPNRVRFLLDCLADLRTSLRDLGGDLLVPRGDTVSEIARLAETTHAGSLFIADERSAYAARRLAGLRRLGLDVSVHPGVTVVPPGDLTPANGDHYRVFTPYWRAWEAARWRPAAAAPEEVRLPSGVAPGPLPRLAELTSGPLSPDLPPGGERKGRERLAAWLREDAAAYDDVHDDLAADRTSRLSPYLKFGCVSPRELAETGPDAFRRQLAWRDFHHQVAAAFPALPRDDYRPKGSRWKTDQDAYAAWRDGVTGVPIVDAGMRQLHREGFMHNRARLITASFLTRDLGID